MSKKLSLILLSVLAVSLFCSIIPLGSSTEYYTISSCNAINDGDYAIYKQHPSATTADSAVGFTFKSYINTKLSYAEVLLGRYHSPASGTVKAALYALASQAWNSNPTGTALATSTNSINIADLVNYGANNAVLAPATDWKRFIFDGTYDIEANTLYAMVIYADSAVGADDGNDCVMVGSIATSIISNYKIGYKSSNWGTTYASDIPHVVMGETVTATPTPTATPAPSSYLWWNGTAWVNHVEITPAPNIFENGVATPYIQMLVPIIILAAAALLGWKFAGAWGFFAGLNIGAILAYMILGSSVFPLWGIVALLVIDGLLLFGKVGIRS